MIIWNSGFRNILGKFNLQLYLYFQQGVTVTTPTSDFQSSEYLLTLLQKDTHYQVIPSHPSSLAYNIQQILLLVIQKEEYKDILLDIALPYYHSYTENDKHSSGLYYGRYIVFQQRILGVKLCCSLNNSNYPEKNIKRWSFGQKINVQPSETIKKFNQSKNISPYKITVGDFILKFRNIHFAIPFQSEVKDYLPILNSFYQNGCSVISIINDVPRQKAFQINLSSQTYKIPSSFQAYLRNASKILKPSILYCGIRMAPITQLYLSRSFITNQNTRQGLPYMFDDGGSCSKIMRVGIFPIINQHPNVLLINQEAGQFKRIKQINNQSSKYIELNSSFTNLFKTMTYWYLFKQINKGKPFIMSVPLTSICEQIKQQMIKIANFLTYPIFNYVVLYKRNSFYVMKDNEKDTNLVLYSSLACYLQKKTGNIHIYSNHIDQIQYLISLAKNNSGAISIKLCYSLIAPTESIKIKNVVKQIIQRKPLEVRSIIDILYRQKLNQEQIWAFCEAFQAELRICPSNNPLLNFFLSQPLETIKKFMNEKILEYVANSWFRKDDETVNKQQLQQCIQISEGESKISKQIRKKRRDFKRALQSFKYFHKKQINCNGEVCHSCNCYVKNYFQYKCLKCSHKTCFVCIQKYKKIIPNSEKEYEICIVCLKLCKCLKCMKVFQEIAPQLFTKQSSKKSTQFTEVKPCAKCLISGKSNMQIKVICQACRTEFCYQCLKINEPKILSDHWECKACRSVRVVSQIKEINRFQQSQTLQTQQVCQQKMFKKDRLKSVQQQRDKQNINSRNFITPTKQSQREDRFIFVKPKLKNVRPQQSQSRSKSSKRKERRRRNRKNEILQKNKSSSLSQKEDKHPSFSKQFQYVKRNKIPKNERKKYDREDSSSSSSRRRNRYSSQSNEESPNKGNDYQNKYRRSYETKQYSVKCIERKQLIQKYEKTSPLRENMYNSKQKGFSEFPNIFFNKNERKKSKRQKKQQKKNEKMNILNREVKVFTEKPSTLWKQAEKPQIFTVQRASLQMQNRLQNSVHRKESYSNSCGSQHGQQY